MNFKGPRRRILESQNSWQQMTLTLTADKACKAIFRPTPGKKKKKEPLTLQDLQQRGH